MEQLLISLISVQERFSPLDRLVTNIRLTPKDEADYCTMLQQAMADMYQFKIVPFDAAARALFKSIGNATIRQCGGSNDAKIACIAASRGLTVVTHNTRDFMVLQEKLSFKIEDWTM
jgi:predicted nucleic acid-binding protein